MYVLFKWPTSRRNTENEKNSTPRYKNSRAIKNDEICSWLEGNLIKNASEWKQRSESSTEEMVMVPLTCGEWIGKQERGRKEEESVEKCECFLESVLPQYTTTDQKFNIITVFQNLLRFLDSDSKLD